MRIACIGAGASSLCFAYKLQRSFDNFNLTLFEKNPRVGGVWVQNRYPGCACDYDAHNYVYSWEPKNDWTSVYASAAEIQGYFEDFAEKYDLHRYCKFNTTVTKAEWLQDVGKWQLSSQSDGIDHNDQYDILINGSGLLNCYKWPKIEGLVDFSGTKLHSAAWPDTAVDTAGKRVGLIGNGSSGQQLLEALHPGCGRLTLFVRQPTWLFGGFGGPQRRYTAEEIQNFKDQPLVLMQKRKVFESRVNSYFGLCLRESPEQAALRKHLTERIKDQLSEQDQHGFNPEDLIPEYAVGCRRPTPGSRYIESLCAPNVDLVVGPITRITADGVVDRNGTLHPLDVLICATGFDTSHRPRFPLLGEQGSNLQDAWATRPSAYLALAVPQFPNYFVFYGPNNPFASGPFLATVEAQAEYMLKWCDRWQTENIHSFAPKQEAVDDFQVYADRILQRTVWADSCRSWYKEHPQDISLWPGSGLHYIEAISSIRGDDFDVRYNGNRWSWLGDGFSQVEQDAECDLSYYIRDHDDSQYLSSRKKRRMAAAGPRVDFKTLHVFGNKGKAGEH
ncbi:hypothetical protein SLS53_008315 [Cytospora paraplurivora]|uniref:Monooxygenase n=1 Tax=Cytospora paraplurivora TaxID=2898453 RepID=A0AAN9YCY8_9PEZI